MPKDFSGEKSLLYGPCTRAIEGLIKEAQSITWFGPILDSQLVNDSIFLHLSRISKMANLNLPAFSEVRFIIGHFGELHQNQYSENPYTPWSQQWNAWKTTLNKFVLQLSEKIKIDPVLAKRIRKPLWSFPGNPNVNGSPIIAVRSHMSVLGNELSESDATVAWALLCKAEADLWNALLCEVACDHLKSSNPFSPLLELYELGYFPMGLTDSIYTVFAYTAPLT